MPLNIKRSSYLKISTSFIISGACKNFDVTLAKDGSPFIFQNSSWWPICGQFFSDNNHGAFLVCKALGYSNGTVAGVESNPKNNLDDKIPMDSFMVGTCAKKDMTLEQCSKRCNLHKIGKDCEKQSCTANHGKRITIQCTKQDAKEASGKETKTSCQSKVFH